MRENNINVFALVKYYGLVSGYRFTVIFSFNTINLKFSSYSKDLKLKKKSLIEHICVGGSNNTQTLMILH